MIHDDRRAFGTLMLKLADVYEKSMSEVVLEAYFEALEDYELEFIEPAIQYLIRTAKWFPKPVEIREVASQFRGEVRRKALPQAQRALGERALTVDEVKAFLAELRARPEYAATLAEIPQKGVEALHADAERLEAIGARDMTDEKRKALEQFCRYLDRGRAQA